MCFKSIKIRHEPTRLLFGSLAERLNAYPFVSDFRLFSYCFRLFSYCFHIVAKLTEFIMTVSVYYKLSLFNTHAMSLSSSTFT